MAAQDTSLDSAHGGGAGLGREPRAVLAGETLLLELFVSGKPKAKGRPRFRRQGDYVKTYTDEQTLSWEQSIGWQVKQAMAQLTVEGALQDVALPALGPIIGELTFNIDKPKSYPKRVTRHARKPDLDNLSKAVLDALQGINIFKDDGQVDRLVLEKRFSSPEHPQGVEILLTMKLQAQ